MGFGEVCRFSRQGICSAWRQFKALGSLRFPDAVQERRFVQHAGEHGLGVMRSAPSSYCLKGRKIHLIPCCSVGQVVIARKTPGKPSVAGALPWLVVCCPIALRTSACRMHRIVDAFLFYFSAKGGAGRHSNPRVAAFISTAGRWASALQLLALAATLFAPRLTARNHELLKASCQPDLATMLLMRWPCTSRGAVYMQGALGVLMVHTLQVVCQHINFLSVIIMTCVITNARSRYQILHACNVMFAAVNFLPGQVWHLPP